MIKALILVHLWSFVVAGGAWVLQRDGDERVGASFPASNIWLILIILSFLPGVLYLVPFGAAISLPDIKIFELIPTQVSESSAEGLGPLNYLAVYMGLSLLLIIRTLWRWSRLQRLPLMPTTEPDVFTTTSEVPPLTLSWPRRAVVIPHGFQVQAALLRHERAHLHHKDAELTLLLLLLQDMMLRTPGVSYLVRQWRLSIELRADHAATKMLSTSERKNYAALLLNIQRPNGDGGGALPCPTAQLSSTRHRNVKMRLGEIIKSEPNVRKRRWSVAVLLTSIAASVIGLMSPGATAKATVIDKESSPIDYIKQTALQLPTSCPGLNLDGVKVETKELLVNGRLVPQQTFRLGTVILEHDVRRDGRTHNPRIAYSSHPCFDANAKAALAQWRTAPQEFEIKDAAVKLHFIMSGATVEELKLQLDDFL